MDCLHEAAPSDEMLIGFALDGEALPEHEQNHLEHCPTCQKRVAYYQRSHAALVARFYRTQCPPGTNLSLFAMGMLQKPERQRITDHLAICPLCSDEVEESYSFIQSWPTQVTVPAPAQTPFIRRIFAALVTHPQPQFALRNDPPSNDQPRSWPRHYQGETVDVSLHLSHTSKGDLVLVGVLTSTESDESIEALADIPAELYSAPWPGTLPSEEMKPLPLLSAKVDDIGNIVFKAIPAGEYFMVIHLPGREMIIEGLAIENT